jgi:hypothetical protein
MFITISYSCTFPPLVQTIPHEKLISNTKDIVLARVVSGKSISGLYKVKYNLEVIEQIKGKSKKTFEIEGSSLTSPNEASDFNNHSDVEFWQGSSRIYNNPACSITPSFAVGNNYLIFINSWKYDHVNSFELILSSHDLWYKKVKELVK